MNRGGDRRNANNNEDDRNSGLWGGAALAAGVAALAGGIYYLSTRNSEPEQQAQNRTQSLLGQPGDRRRASAEGSIRFESGGGRITSVPDTAVINNLNALLSDIYVRYIALRQEDFELHYRVFDVIFHQLHSTMKIIDPYYERYSSTVSFAGSHYDKLRIKKPDEFDMDIVIGMPLNLSENPLNPIESDIVFEPKGAGFVELKMGKQFQNLPMRDGVDWQINKTAYKWKDDNDYLLRSKFIDWFKSLVVRALNNFETNARMYPVYTVDGVQYTIDRTESGPAITLIVENKNKGFRMDVDLVPALRFPEKRWPLNSQYRNIPNECKKDYWMVVPKPDKNNPNDQSKVSRSWRIALHNQENQLMYNCYNLKQTIRLIKKLRDAQGMKKIASYYIKTLFFWEIVHQNNVEFWRKSQAELFKIMVQRLYKAVCDGEIPYYWNRNNNLIAGVGQFVLAEYREKLSKLLTILGDPAKYKTVAKFLLTPSEFEDYNRRFLNC